MCALKIDMTSVVYGSTVRRRRLCSERADECFFFFLPFIIIYEFLFYLHIAFLLAFGVLVLRLGGFDGG